MWTRLMTLLWLVVVFLPAACIEKPDAWSPGAVDVEVVDGNQRTSDRSVAVDALPVDSGSREVNVEDGKDFIADDRVPQDADSVPEIYDSAVADVSAPADNVEVVDDVGSDGDLPTDTNIDAETTDTALDTTCVPNCTGKVCGNDGCGGSCGTCPPAAYCTQGACFETGSKHFAGVYTFVPDLGPLGAKTYSFWVNVEDVAVGQTLIIKKDKKGQVPEMLPINIGVSGGQLRANVNWAGGPGSVNVASVPIQSQKWYFVIWQVSEAKAELYVQGSLVGQMALPGGSIDNESNYTIGAAPSVNMWKSQLYGEMYNLRVTSGFLFDSSFIPCDVDVVDADSFFVNFSGPVPCYCVPDCIGKDCGDDGCAESCGTCADDESCVEDQCVSQQ